ncbi:hypothetical protein HBH92_170530 [Parastagonospora nodorum]|nr:hypothetical protein HBH92_170530 [Parastagonospora nodorum]KAH4427934.1 hypothetical protein HBH93_164670 [Parastagonospora nodorum]KAH4438162.1 hypothetical protein HBH91_188480 [Parastagonospora nodorum]KAH4498141.1 hypothetical protein HBH89_130540 [Parastagonospora nodorum]KAH4533334.1 hypothetical protein HBH85_172980 [Parastagonospora nodorum]
MSSIEDTPLDLGLADMALESSTQAAEDFINIHEQPEIKNYIGFLTSCKTIFAEVTEIYVGPYNRLAPQEKEKFSASYSKLASHGQFGGIRIPQLSLLGDHRLGIVSLPQYMFVNAYHGQYKPPNAIGHEHYSDWCEQRDGYYRMHCASPVPHLPMTSSDIDTLVIKTWADNLPTLAHLSNEARLCHGSSKREINPRKIVFDWSDMKPPAGAQLRNSVILSPKFSRRSTSLPGNWSVEEIFGPRGLISMRWTCVSNYLCDGTNGHWCSTCIGNP